MADSVKIQKITDRVTARLNKLASNSKNAQGFFMRVIYPMYQNFQRERWQTEGASEGTPWPALSKDYSARKKIMYGGGPKFKWVGGRDPGPWISAGNWPSYPGSGSKMLIATGRLFGAVLGPGGGIPGGEQFHKVLATPTSLTISVDISKAKSGKDQGSEYFQYVNEKRKFMIFSKRSIAAMKYEIRSYLVNA